MPTIATNTAANTSLFYLNRNSAEQSDSLSKISSGSRIVSSADDAAGLAISDQLQSDITALETASQTTQQIEALLQIADGGLARVSDILERMTSLATQFHSGTLDATSQGFINDEYVELETQIDLIVDSTQYNGQGLIDAGYNETAVVGVDATNIMTIDLSSVDVDSTALLGALSTAGGFTDGSSAADIALVDAAIDTIGAARALVGALTSAVGYQSDNIDTQITNLESAKSSIFDVDLAEEQTNFTNYQVLTEAAISGLAQANQMKTSLLALLG